MSSSSIDFPCPDLPWDCSITLSFSPSLHSGIPLRNTRILRAPTISECTTVPFAFTTRFTFSTTSRNTSFLLWWMPSLRHETALVTAIGGFLVCSILCASVWMNSDRILPSVNCGYPKSMTSSSSS